MLQSQSNRSVNDKNSSYVNRIRPEQISTLEQEFAKARTLHNTDLELLAAEMGLDERDVQAWYADRLAAWRREQGLSDGFGQY
ncbi:hypothetical protein V9T40_002878 [Parthenolecanium corni]|uniref:Homeodomain-only protein n=1 Tax=Parthenolecanium corni TaxID=536013 RepID=A0AAN9TJN2_9HEMI